MVYQNLRRTVNRLRRIGRNEHGQVLVLFAAGLVAIAGFVGMSIDIGQAVYTASDVQKIADAAALAGSQDLPNTTSATTTANSYAAQNGTGTLAISFSDSNTVIKVTATRHVNYTFLRVLGLSGKDISRSAAARGKPIVVTGYSWANAAPFIIWGGGRQKEVHPGDKECDFYTCVGRSYTFMDVNWMNASGNPTAPDWTASNSNNFKGDVDHGNGAPVNQVGDTFSVGGLGSVTVPTPGDVIVIPVVNTAADNSNLRSFHIVAWVIVKVDANCTKSHCTGTVLDPKTTAPPSGWVGGGSVPPPPTLTYTGRDSGLIQ
jgi:hypothetical protein